MRDSVDTIHALRETTLHSDATFTLGSIGVEKATKIMLGCAEVERSGRWPSRAQMKTWGHDIETLVRLLLTEAEQQQSNAVATDYAASLVARVRDSTTLPLLFSALSRYGRSGRFHYLDVLATDAVGEFEAPIAYWDRLETHVAQALGRVPHDSPDEFEAFLRRVSATIAHELDVWWFVVHRLGVQGCFGELGKTMGWSIWPPGRATPFSA